MKRSEHLFQLIKSLSKSEKRSFKIFANGRAIGSKNNYIILFDAIDKQELYDEFLLVKKLNDPKLINNLSAVKVQLYNLILKSLRQHNSSNRVTYNLRMQMDCIDILFEKGLYSQSKKILKKAQKIACQYEIDNIISSLSKYEYQISLKNLKDSENEKSINVTPPEVEKILKRSDL